MIKSFFRVQQSASVSLVGNLELYHISIAQKTEKCIIRGLLLHSLSLYRFFSCAELLDHLGLYESSFMVPWLLDFER